MAKLNILGNETRKDQETQNGQIQIAFQDLQTWSNNILTKQLVFYKDTDTSNLTTTSKTYTPFGNFTTNFNINNPLNQLTYNICLSGEGTIGLFVNDNLTDEKYFKHGTNSINLCYSRFLTLNNGPNKIYLQWKATTGTITKNVTTNILEVVSFNS